MAGKLLGSASKSQQAQSSTTFVWGLPNGTSALAVASSSPAFDVQYAAATGIDPGVYEPVLVKLAQTANHWRLVGAGSTIVGAGGVAGATMPPKITEERTQVKFTRLSADHLRLEPAVPLAPGEYAIVVRPVAPQRVQIQSDPSKMNLQAAGMQQLFYAVWDFSVPASVKSPR
jgi:hypothetical protein